MLLEEQREQVVEACQTMQHLGLVVGTAGNVSVRDGGRVVISPSGIDYDHLAPEDVLVVDLEGNIIEGYLQPSSELPLHLAVYNSSDALAITHNHAPASTALGLLVDEVPATHYYTGMFGGRIRVAPFALFGTEQLARNVVEALCDRAGALMANHGAITVGPTLEKALGLLPYLEYVCEVHLRALTTGPPMKELTDDELEQARVGMAVYGQPPQSVEGGALR